MMLIWGGPQAHCRARPFFLFPCLISGRAAAFGKWVMHARPTIGQLKPSDYAFTVARVRLQMGVAAVRAHEAAQYWRAECMGRYNTLFSTLFDLRAHVVVVNRAARSALPR